MASGGEVSHLESWLPLRFAPRSSGQIATAIYKQSPMINFSLLNKQPDFEI